jgi:peptide/nickel transport system permease protein
VAVTPVQTELGSVPVARSRTAAARARLEGIWARPITRAVLKAILTIWTTITLTFWLIRLMPGNPIDLKIDELTREGAITYDEAKVMASSLFRIDLTRPIQDQYVEYMGDVLRGDLGSSFLSAGTPVTSIILSVLPWTLFAVGTGVFLAFLVGIGLGILAAYRRGGVADGSITTVGSIVSSVPNYLVALLIILVLGVQLRWLPITRMRGAFSPGVEPGFTPEFIGDVLFHAALPISVFFLATIGHWILSMRGSTLAALEEDYVNAARARGIGDARIATAYVGRNAILPLVSQLAIAAGASVGGAVFIEQVFVYQGMGLRLVKAIDQRDYPIMQGIVLVTTVAIVAANLIADLVYSRLDPRIGRAGGSSG